MASKTANFGLHKFDLSDSPPDITVLNPSMEIIDSELKKSIGRGALPDITNSTTILNTIKNYYANGVKSGQFFSLDNVSDNPERNWSFGIEFFDCGRSLVLVKAYKTQVSMTYYRQLSIETGEYLYDWVCDFNTGNKPTPTDVEAITYGTKRPYINVNEDLNNYIICGGYKCVNNTAVETLVNCPVNTAFTLDVLSGTGEHSKSDSTIYSYIVQNIRTLDGEMWYRRISTNPTDNSTSYGEWKHVATHDTVPVNNNLLINSNFANPVNQRQFTELTVSTVTTRYDYTIDRWVISGYEGSTATTLKLGDGCVILSGDKTGDGWTNFGQFVEKLPKGTYTLSTKINGKIYSHTFAYNQEDGFSTWADFENDTISIGVNSHSHWKDGELHPFVWISNQSKNLASASIEWAKLEAGSVATPYVPRLYGEELDLCQRYYQTVVTNAVFIDKRSDTEYLALSNFVKTMRIAPTVKVTQAFAINTNLRTTFLASYVIEDVSTDSMKLSLTYVETLNNNFQCGGTIIYEADAEL